MQQPREDWRGFGHGLPRAAWDNIERSPSRCCRHRVGRSGRSLEESAPRPPQLSGIGGVGLAQTPSGLCSLSPSLAPWGGLALALHGADVWIVGQPMQMRGMMHAMRCPRGDVDARYEAKLCLELHTSLAFVPSRGRNAVHDTTLQMLLQAVSALAVVGGLVYARRAPAPTP